MVISLALLFFVVFPIIGGVSNSASVLIIGFISGIASYRAGFGLVTLKIAIFVFLTSVLLLQMIDANAWGYLFVLLAIGWSASKIVINLIVKSKGKEK